MRDQRATESAGIRQTAATALFAVVATLLLVALRAAIGALTRGTANLDPPVTGYPDPDEAVFTDVRAPVLGAVIGCAVIGLAAVGAGLFSGAARRRAVSIGAVIAAVIGAAALGIVRRATGLFAGEGDPLGSGLPATRSAWLLAVVGLALLVPAALAAGPVAGPLRLRWAGVAVSVADALVAAIVVGLPQTYAGAVAVVPDEIRETAAALLDRVQTTPRQTRAHAAQAIGPGYFGGGRMHNADGSPRWHLTVDEGMYAGWDATVFPDEQVVVVILTRPDGDDEYLAVDADSGDVRWRADGRWNVGDADLALLSGDGREPRHHLLDVEGGELRAGSPSTGGELWRYRAQGTIHRLRDGADRIGVVAGTEDRTTTLTYLDARTGEELPGPGSAAMRRTRSSPPNAGCTRSSTATG